MVIYLKSTNLIQVFLVIYYLVPATIDFDIDRLMMSSGNSCTVPKSAIFGFHSLSSKMFFSLISRCMIRGVTSS